MVLSDISIDRPVFATVISLLLVAFGVMSFVDLPLRQYPDINPPVISVSTTYRGASAEIVESKITRLIEDQISGIEGINTISSSSQDGRSTITIEFNVDRNIDAAANDVRGRVSKLVAKLPKEADPPEISKVDTNDRPIMWLRLKSATMSRLELADYAKRFLVDRLSSIKGVARIWSSSKTYAMRIWLNRQQLAARNITVNDVERALRSENIDLPAGRVESTEREFTVRVERKYKTARDFARLVIRKTADGHLIRLGAVAKVVLGAEDTRSEMRSNQQYMVALGIIKQSKGNTLAVARAVKKDLVQINKTLPPGTSLQVIVDKSIFIEAAINEVYKTFAIAMGLVVLVIYLFLGSARAMFIPAITVPVSITASFIFLNMAGYSINLLTLLALILSIGLVVDDAILVLENIYRRIDRGEPPLLAAYYGAREVGFAVIATTLVLIAVFVPIIFIGGETGRLFTEFAMAMAAAVGFSALIALTLAPMLCSRLLRRESGGNRFHNQGMKFLHILEGGYLTILNHLFKHPRLVLATLIPVIALAYGLFRYLPSEFMPLEDQGIFFVAVKAPEGTGFNNMKRQMKKVEGDMMTLVDNGKATMVLARVPSFGVASAVNSGFGIVILKTWDKRDQSAQQIRVELTRKLAKHPDIRAFVFMPRGISGMSGSPVQFVLQGSNYQQLAHWRDLMMARARHYPGFTGLDSDYKATKPQLLVDIDLDKAADLGVSVSAIGSTLETMLGARRVTTFSRQGEEYPVILKENMAEIRTPEDMTNIYVRSARSGRLIPLSSLITLKETASSPDLKRFNRMRSITLSANLKPGYSLGQALDFLQQTSREILPATAHTDFSGESRTYKQSGSSVYFVFILALITVFLVLAAQFESFRHPFVILLTVPFAMVGALLGLYFSGQPINIYSQIGLIMLVGLATKNGILIVEFANQLRDQGVEFVEALREASRKRLRPIVMTSFTTIMGSVALVVGGGAGAETRFVLGIVIISGVSVATLFTLFIVPVAYLVIARNSSSPKAVQNLRLALENRLTRKTTK
ncbi:MAG: efflux RND transporter permease subunit [Alphaproteobacteria bacterium]|nr:efflux RND transporter permease subunit [Alphaproteobacteria bacterium]